MDNDRSAVGKKMANLVATSKVPTVSSTTTVGEAEKLLSTEKIDQYDSVNYIYILNEKNNLRGIVSIKEIFRNASDTRLSGIMTTDLITVRGHSPQEKAALLAVKNNIKAVPVIDKDGKFLGVITSDTILNILHEENVEDMLYTAGIGRLNNPEIKLIDASVSDHIKVRLPWLIVGLIGGIFAAIIVSGFDSLIRQMILLTAFLPAVVYIGDAVGVQSQTIIIRSLVLDKNLSFMKYMWRELAISILIGVIIGAAAGVISQIFWGNLTLALIISVSFILTIILSSIVGIILPLVFDRFKVDPAIGSGPLATVIRDILSIVVYFTVASFFLRNW
ncbi:MAG: magnesium transporter [Candidatus Levybacteria bacterium]|nr:magnesium transporter [Candidatus Levybacteria bacterium]